MSDGQNAPMQFSASFISFVFSLTFECFDVFLYIATNVDAQKHGQKIKMRRVDGIIGIISFDAIYIHDSWY